LRPAGPAAETAVPASVLLETAGTLAERGFPAQAREMYLQVLGATGLGSEERANAAYLLAELELNRLGDPASAYGHYLLAQTLGPSESASTAIQTGMVASLERAGRSLAAADLLKDSTALVPAAPSAGGRTVATIGKTPVTEAEVKAALDVYPEQVKAQFQGEEGLKRFTQQFVAMKVVLDAARRAGLGQGRQSGRADGHDAGGPSEAGVLGAGDRRQGECHRIRRPRLVRGQQGRSSRIPRTRARCPSKR